MERQMVVKKGGKTNEWMDGENKDGEIDRQMDRKLYVGRWKNAQRAKCINIKIDEWSDGQKRLNGTNGRTFVPLGRTFRQKETEHQVWKCLLFHIFNFMF